MSAELHNPIYDTAARRRRILDELRRLFDYRDLLRNMVWRNITTRYKRSVLGMFWTLLDPLLTTAMMSVVFTALFSRTLPGFPVFLLSGLVAWNFFNQASHQAINDLLRGGGLLGRVNLPLSIFPVSAIGSGVINLLLALLPIFGLVFIFQRPVTAALFFLPISLLILALFTLGLGFLVSSFAVFFSDVLNIFDIFMRLLFYISGIIYNLEMLPKALSNIVQFIPTYHMVSLFRMPLYEGKIPDPFSLGYAVISALVMFLLGFWVFMRFSDEYSYRI
jgi:ABC-type polysaccharide/polyol phosphate export permease